MTVKIVPANIEILSQLVNRMDGIAPLLSEKSAPFQSFRTALKSVDFLEDNTAVHSHSDYTTFFQVLYLALVSMHGGILIPNLSSLSASDTQVTLTWNSGFRDQFIWGVWDDDFKKFWSTLKHSVFASHKMSLKLTSTILGESYHRLADYIKTLITLEKNIDLILESESQVSTILENKNNRNFLFILIACLPTEQLNALFLHISQFLPKDLTVKSPDGHLVRAVSLFENSSTDTKFLLEKSKTYLYIYQNTNSPIIQEITHIKTISYLTDLLSNPTLRRNTITHLNHMKTLQCQPRSKLYGIICDPLGALL